MYILLSLSLLALLAYFGIAKNKKTTTPASLPDNVQTSHFRKIQDLVNLYFPGHQTLAKLAYAVAMHETAKFTSTVYRENKNLYGYKAVKGNRWQIAEGRRSPEGNAYAAYSDTSHSIEDFFAWLRNRQTKNGQDWFKVRTPQQMAEAMKKYSYFTAPLTVYSNALTKHFNSL